jgi:hypothetical protein
MTPSSNSGASAIGGGIATRAQDGPDYVLLSAPTLVRSYEYTRIYDFHLRGTMTNHGFMPAGQIQGNGKFCAEGKDWISLSDMSVHKAGTGTPSAPYVLGCANANGTFTPATRDVVTQ